MRNARDILARQEDVSIDAAALARFAHSLKGETAVPDWKGYISDTTETAAGYDFGRAFYEFALLTAQQGGFIDADKSGGARKWQRDGSGAKAMVGLLAEIRREKALPFFDIAEDEVAGRIGPLLAGVPFAAERLEIFREFASAGNHRRAMDLLARSFDGETYLFDMPFVQALAEIFPKGLGGDPFMKKALLSVLSAAAHGHHRGVSADITDLPVAADYILPQVLNADHVQVLKFSPALTEKLDQRALFAESAPEVEALRAAAVVAGEELAALSGLDARQLDSHLWKAGRGLQNARPHMMCRTLRF